MLYCAAVEKQLQTTGFCLNRREQTVPQTPAFNIKTSQVSEFLFRFSRFARRARRFLGLSGASAERDAPVFTDHRAVHFGVDSRSSSASYCYYFHCSHAHTRKRCMLQHRFIYTVRGSAAGSGSAVCVVLNSPQSTPRRLIGQVLINSRKGS